MYPVSDGKRRLQFMQSCELLVALPLTCGRGEEDGMVDLNRRWKDLPANFLSSMDSLMVALDLFESFNAVPNATAPTPGGVASAELDDSKETKAIQKMCSVLLVQNMMWVLNQALSTNSFLATSEGGSPQLEAVLIDWINVQLDSYEDRWQKAARLFQSPIFDEYKQRTETIAALENAGKQLESLQTTLDCLNDLWHGKSRVASGVAVREKIGVLLEQANYLKVAVRTVCWPMKTGMPNSAMVQLVNEAIAQRKATVNGDILASFLLVQLDIGSPNYEGGPIDNFIQALANPPRHRPQATAELLVYLLLWSPKTAGYAADVEHELLKPEEAAWIRAMSIITNRVSFASVGADHYAPQDTTHSPFKRADELSSDLLHNLRELWAVAEIRTKEVYSSTVKDYMDDFHEQAATLAEYGSAESIRARELEKRAEEFEIREKNRRMAMSSGGIFSEDTIEQFRVQDTFRLSNVTFERDREKAKLAPCKSQLEDEVANLHSVQNQLEVVNAKIQSSLDSLNSIAVASADTVRTDISPQDEHNLHLSFAATFSRMVDHTIGRARPEQPTSATGKEADESFEGTDVAVATVNFLQRSDSSRRIDDGVPQVHYRLSGSYLNFKQLKEKACHYFRLSDPSKYELFSPDADAVWYEQADVMLQLQAFDRETQQSAIVLRKRKKVKGKYVRPNIVGDNGALAKIDVRAAKTNDLTLEQLEERQRLEKNEIQERAIQVIEQLVRRQGPRRTKSQRFASVAFNLLMTMSYLLYTFNVYSSIGRNASSVTSAARHVVHEIPFSGGPYVRFEDTKINNVGLWISETLSTTLLRPTWYGTFDSGSQVNSMPTFSATFDENIAWSGLRLVQIRSKPLSCNNELPLAEALGVAECYSDEIDEQDYAPGWLPLDDASVDPAIEGFRYTTHDVAGGESVVGIDARSPSYGPGGYTRFVPNAESLRPAVEELVVNGWLDERTRAIVISGNAHNRAYNLLTAVSILFEFRYSGHIVRTVRVNPIPIGKKVPTQWESLRLAVISVHLLMLIMMLKKMQFHWTYHKSIQIRARAFKQLPWLSVMITLLLAAEVVCRLYLDRELDSCNASNQKILDFFNNASLSTLSTPDYKKAVESAISQASFQDNVASIAYLSLQAQSIVGLAVLFLCTKSALALVKFSSAWYLFVQYLIISGGSAIAAVLLTFVLIMFGLARLANAAYGPNSSQFNSMPQAIAALFQLIVSPNRAYEAENPFALYDWAPDADIGGKAEVPFFPLLVLFEISVMIMIWSFLVSVFLEAYSHATTNYRDEVRLRRSLARLQQKPPGKNMCELLHTSISDGFTFLGDVLTIVFSVLSLANKFAGQLRLGVDVNGTSAQYQRLRRVMTFLEVEISEADQGIVLDHQLTESRYKTQLAATLQAYGLAQQLYSNSDIQVKPSHERRSCNRADSISFIIAPSDLERAPDAQGVEVLDAPAPNPPKYTSSMLEDELIRHGCAIARDFSAASEAHSEQVPPAQEPPDHNPQAQEPPKEPVHPPSFEWTFARQRNVLHELAPRDEPYPEAPVSELLPPAAVRSRIKPGRAGGTCATPAANDTGPTAAQIGGPWGMAHASRYLRLEDDLDAAPQDPNAVRSSLRRRLPDDHACLIDGTDVESSSSPRARSLAAVRRCVNGSASGSR